MQCIVITTHMVFTITAQISRYTWYTGLRLYCMYLTKLCLYSVSVVSLCVNLKVDPSLEYPITDYSKGPIAC